MCPMNRCNRREFLQRASLVPVAAAVAGLGQASAAIAGGEPIKRVGGAQLKVSLNAYSFPIATDLVKPIKIVRASNYRGYLPIETLSPRDKVYDPYTVVPAFLKQLRDAIAQTA